MPEGDTVHKLAGLLREGLEGRRISHGGVCADPESSFAGREVRQVFARGKHLFVELEGELLVRTHLGMHGSWHRYAHEEGWRKSRSRASVVLATDDEVYVLFDAREVQRMKTNSLAARDAQARLGPDLIADELDLETLLMRARGFVVEERPVVDLLLDQHVGAPSPSLPPPPSPRRAARRWRAPSRSGP